MTRQQANEIRRIVADAEAGRASLPSLRRAHDLCGGAGAVQTAAFLEKHINKIRMKDFGRMILAGLISGSVVTLTVGRIASRRT